MVEKGAGRDGRAAVGEVEAQLLANHGWVVIAVWKDPVALEQESREALGLDACAEPTRPLLIHLRARRDAVDRNVEQLARLDDLHHLVNVREHRQHHVLLREDFGHAYARAARESRGGREGW